MNLHFRVFVLFLLSLFCISCEKENQTIGIGMLPDSDLLTTAVDSSTIITMQTVADDSTRSTLVTYMLGENYDEKFGKTRASYATRLYIQSMIVDMADYKLDSACFSLAKSAKYVYGDTTVGQQFSVYELSQPITVEDCKKYEQTGSKPAWTFSETNKICDIQVPAYKDTLKTYSCKLAKEFATELFSTITECSKTDTSLQYVDSLFINKFYGIYVTTKNNTFNDNHSVIVHSLPNITFYLSGKDTTKTIILAPSPQPYNEALKTDPSQIYLQAINFFEHDYSTTEITFNTESNTSYVQGFMGAKTKITFSDLEKWREAVDYNTPSDSTIVINSAKLYLPIKKYDTWNEYLPLNFRVYDETKTPHKLVYSTLSTTEDSTNFIFNIHSFLITLYNGKTKANNFSYEIAIPENNAYGNMFVLDGTTDPKKLKLVITYTK